MRKIRIPSILNYHFKIMRIARRQPGIQPSFTPKQAAKTKQFNQDLRMVQGFRFTVSTGSSSQPISLNSSGKFLLGLSVTPANGADITDTQITFLVNNLNLLLDVSAANLNPNFVGNMVFFALPQELKGNDTMTISFNNNDASPLDLYVNIFYVPLM
jgi:hypothetical protein